MSEPAAVDVDDALDRLVEQFADPFAFFRELVQNSLDAGSQEVDIRLVHDGRVLVVHVDDWGEGMDRAIIDRQLTRLFSSSKDGDMTKIGKFGIGFVSVFALDPEAVCVDTSRSGETWRVLFAKDRSFTRLRLGEVLEGTKIRIIVNMEASEFPAFEARAGEAVRFWCRHASGEVRFQGEVMNEPFDLEASVSVRHRDDLSEMIVGHGNEGTVQGFYRQGLTLLERRDAVTIPELEGLAFKVSSRWIAHTLSRDDVMVDKNFHKMRRKLVELVHGELNDAVLGALESVVLGGRPPSEFDHLYGPLAWHVRASHDRGRARKTWYRKIARSPSGRPLDLDDLVRAGTMLAASGQSGLTDALEAAGHRVLLVPAETRDGPGSNLRRFLGELGEVRWARERFCLPTEPDPDSGDAAGRRALADACGQLLAAMGARVERVLFADFLKSDSLLLGRVGVTCDRFGELVDLADALRLGETPRSPRRTLVLDEAHPLVGELERLATKEPELAAHQLVKAFHLAAGELDVDRVALLTERTWELRCRRQTS